MTAPAHLATGEAHLLLAYLPAAYRAALAHALACTSCRQLLSSLLEGSAALAAAEAAAGAEKKDDVIDADFQEVDEKDQKKRA